MPFEHWLTTPKEWYRLRPIAQARRNFPTPHLASLWERLRRRQLHRLQFRRQEAIGGYLVDFFAYGPRLAIVIEEPHMSGHLQSGAMRTKCFAELGVLELRIPGEEIDADIDSVVERIAEVALQRRRRLRVERIEHLQRIEREAGGGGEGVSVEPESIATMQSKASRVREHHRNYRVWPSSRRQWRRLRECARGLRRDATASEAILWTRLRNRQLDGLAFRRQRAIDAFIVDFYCAAAKLVIEIDGPIHDERIDRDDARTERLEALGYTVLRFSNDEVSRDTQSVLAAILSVVRRRTE
jgi:very-short-patch-repair endonuclease